MTDESKRMSFSQMCAALPEDFSWGDSLTPDVFQHIEAAILQAATRSDAPAIPTGCVVIEEADMVPYVHPQYGSGLFVTEDCVNKMQATTRDAPSADAVDEIVPWWKVMELAEKHGKGWSQYSGWAFMNDDDLHAFAQAIAASEPREST